MSCSSLEARKHPRRPERGPGGVGCACGDVQAARESAPWSLQKGHDSAVLMEVPSAAAALGAAREREREEPCGLWRAEADVLAAAQRALSGALRAVAIAQARPTGGALTTAVKTRWRVRHQLSGMQLLGL